MLEALLLLVGGPLMLFALIRISRLTRATAQLERSVDHLNHELPLARKAMWAMQERIEHLDRCIVEQRGLLREQAAQLQRTGSAAALESAPAEQPAEQPATELDAASESVAASASASESVSESESVAASASASESVSESVAASVGPSAGGAALPAASLGPMLQKETQQQRQQGQRPGAERRRQVLQTIGGQAQQTIGGQAQQGAVGQGGAAAGFGQSSGAPEAASGAATQGLTGSAATQGAADFGEQAPAFDWEQWIGVRGAAALGAAILVLAGGYFFKYSVDHGLISPLMRVVLGVVVALACLTGSELWLRKRHVLLANSLAGAGFAILYLCFWAAKARYGLIGTAVAGALMVLVTVSCGVLSVKHDARLVAVFGLVGGFATPIMLSTGSDRPFALFGYLLLLNVALLYVARRRRWPLLTLVSLGFTGLYQAAWIIWRMGPDRVVLGLAISLLFAAVFVLAPKPQLEPAGPAEDPNAHLRNKQVAGVWSFMRVCAVFTPFVFALYFGLRTSLTPEFGLLGIFLAILVVGARLIGRRDQLAAMGAAAACAGLAS